MIGNWKRFPVRRERFVARRRMYHHANGRPGLRYTWGMTNPWMLAKLLNIILAGRSRNRIFVTLCINVNPQFLIEGM